MLSFLWDLNLHEFRNYYTSGFVLSIYQSDCFINLVKLAFMVDKIYHSDCRRYVLSVRFVHEIEYLFLFKLLLYLSYNLFLKFCWTYTQHCWIFILEMRNLLLTLVLYLDRWKEFVCFHWLPNIAISTHFYNLWFCFFQQITSHN